LHGAEGEDGSIQKILEDKGIKYLGSSSASSKICFDKGLAKTAMAQAGIPLAEGATVTPDTYMQHPLAQKPHVLKVLRGGSSIGTYIVRDPALLDDTKVAEVFSLDNEAVIEELLPGPEITVPVLGNKALPVIEIIPPVNGEFDYENKYNGASQEICPAVSIDENKQQEAQALAEKVHRLLNCRHFSRVDIMLRQNGELVVLEANTIPGMTKQSLFPLSAKVAGMPMPELMKKFVDLITKQ